MLSIYYLFAIYGFCFASDRSIPVVVILKALRVQNCSSSIWNVVFNVNDICAISIEKSALDSLRRLFDLINDRCSRRMTPAGFIFVIEYDLYDKISAGATFTPHDSELRLIEIIRNLLN